MRNTILASLFLLFTPIRMFAQCTASQTLQDCWKGIIKQAAANTAAAATQQNTTSTNTGLTSLVSPSASTLRDFLSVFTAALESSSLTSNGNALTFDWNPKFGKDQPLKVQVVFAKPTLSSAAATAFGTNAAGLSTVKDSLTNTDDVSASVSYSPATLGFGRSIEPHRTYYDSLTERLFDASAMAQAQADDALIVALQSVGVSQGDLNKPIDQITNDATKQKELIDALEAAARALRSFSVQLDTLTRSFSKLLNNQPQPYGSLLYHERKNVVGPTETVFKATYEYGFRNLNRFFRLYRAKCDALSIATLGDAAKDDCIELINKYAGDGTADETGDGGRIAVSLEYHDARPVHVDLTQYSVKYDIDSGRSWVGSITGGWIIAPRENRKSGRVDLSVSYEDIRNAAVLTGTTGTPPADVKDRLIASITYTQKISDTISFPIALVYANHAAFLSNIDRKLNAHFGLQYKLPTK